MIHEVVLQISLLWIDRASRRIDSIRDDVASGRLCIEWSKYSPEEGFCITQISSKADKFSEEYRKQQGVAFKSQGMMRNVKIIVQYDIVWRNTYVAIFRRQEILVGKNPGNYLLSRPSPTKQIDLKDDMAKGKSPEINVLFNSMHFICGS